MTREEFIIATKELEEYYGKDLNYKQRDVWFNELCSFKTEKYERAVKNICMTSRYMPLLSEVVEAVRSQKNAIEEEEKVPCDLCKGTGYITYRRKINGMEYEYVCLCICANARGKEYNGAKIQDKEHRSPYYIKTAQEVFGNAIPQPETKKAETKKDTQTEQITF